MALKGKELTKSIEEELSMMLVEGFDKAPITNKTLHTRLKARGIISGAVSTLQSRKQLIEDYKNKQIEDSADESIKASLKLGVSANKEAIIKQNANLREQLKQSKEMLAKNTNSLLEIVKSIENSGQGITVERYLAPHLIKEMVEERNKSSS